MQLVLSATQVPIPLDCRHQYSLFGHLGFLSGSGVGPGSGGGAVLQSESYIHKFCSEQDCSLSKHGFSQDFLPSEFIIHPLTSLVNPSLLFINLQTKYSKIITNNKNNNIDIFFFVKYLLKFIII